VITTVTRPKGHVHTKTKVNKLPQPAHVITKVTTEVIQCMSPDDFHAKPIMKIYQPKGKKSIRVGKSWRKGWEL